MRFGVFKIKFSELEVFLDFFIVWLLKWICIFFVCVDMIMFIFLVFIFFFWKE